MRAPEQTKQLEPLFGGIVKDRGANVRRAGYNLVGEDDEADSVDCFTHLLKSVIDRVMSDTGDRRAYRDLKFILSVSSNVRGSLDGLALFESAAGADVAHLTPLRENDTRWNGYDMSVKRFLQQKDAWIRFAEDPAVLSSLTESYSDVGFPDDPFFQRASFLSAMFGIFMQASKWGQKQRAPLLPFLVKRIHELKSQLEPADGDSNFESCLREAFLSAVEELLDPLVHGVTAATKAAALNPEIMLEDFLSAKEIEDSVRALKHETALFVLPEEPGLMALKRKAQTGLFKAAYASLELERRKAVPRSMEDFWKGMEREYSSMNTLARLYLSMPVSAVKPETVFSFTGALVSKRRTGLKPDNVEAMAVINDFTRQDGYSFETLLKEVSSLVLEWKEEEGREEEEAANNKVAQLEQDLEEAKKALQKRQQSMVAGKRGGARK